MSKPFNTIVMTEKEQVLCIDVIQSLKDKFISGGWITVSDEFVHSALVSYDKVDECMCDYQWDLRPGNNGAHVNTYSDGSYEYVRDNVGLEMFAIFRDGYGTHPPYVELSEEFRLFCNMHEKYKSEDERDFITIDENGNENVVAIIKGTRINIKAKLLRSYLAVRKINLLIFVDIMRYSKHTFSELGITPVQNKIVSCEDFIYNYTSLIEPQYDGNKSGGWLLGKCLLKYNAEDFNPEQYPYINDDNYEEFIIGYDKNGDELSYTCDERRLSNYFKKHGNAPLTVTPVFFRKTVLDKYYKDPNKFIVDDGYISNEGMWSIRVDNDQRDYVVVILGDIGRLPHEEQLYWKGCNIAPPPNAKISNTAYARWFDGRFCNPEFSDLKFKYQFRLFNELWEKINNWQLFLPLVSDDIHRFKTLHCLTKSNNPSDFEEQILSMTKIIIDSLNEAELVRNIDETNVDVQARLKELKVTDKRSVNGGISKFELYLISQGKDLHESILFLRNLQELRSSTTAHRKSRSKTKNYESYFLIQNRTQQEILEDIFNKGIDLLKVLKESFLLEKVKKND
jgi:hypothetical protein